MRVKTVQRLGSSSHARLFDAPQQGQAPDQRTADSIRKALKGRMERLLPAPTDANDQSAPAALLDDEVESEESGVAGGEAG